MSQGVNLDGLRRIDRGMDCAFETGPGWHHPEGRIEQLMKTVLILDDDPTTLLVLSQQFRQHGVQVIACPELEAAEAIMDHTRLDAVITDLYVSPLGGLDGSRLIRHVTTHFPETRVLAMSSRADDEIRRLVLSFGASEFFEKPVDPVKIAASALGIGEEPKSGKEGQLYRVESLEEFLESDQIFSVLQPIVSLGRRTGPYEIHGVEALARAPRESIMKNPEILFDYASRKERLFETDMHCLRAALAEGARLRKKARLFLNVQPRSMTHPDFGRRIIGMVESAGFTPKDIVFEMTEQETILNRRAFNTTLAQLRRMGFDTALDDFGVGVANLNLILDLMPQYVKLSGYFAQGISVDRDKQVVVAAIHSMLRRLGIPAVMERVETEEELDVILKIGFEYAQGYHFARPAPAAELARTGRFVGTDTTIRAAG